MGMTSARVTGLLLAAGAGHRYGRPKGLVVDDDGPWVHRAARALLDGGCGDVLVVTGAAAEEVEALVVELGDERVTTTRCGTWEQGMGESLRAGLTALATRGRTIPVQAVVHLVDLPDVGADVVARVLGAAPESGQPSVSPFAGDGEPSVSPVAGDGEPSVSPVAGDGEPSVSPVAGGPSAALVRAAYDGVAGHPVLLGQQHWQGVLDVARGDAGARAYLRRQRPHLVECGDLATGRDVDVEVGGPGTSAPR